MFHTQKARIRYWSQITQEYGEWVLTEPMLKSVAEVLIERRVFYRGELVET